MHCRYISYRAYEKPGRSGPLRKIFSMFVKENDRRKNAHSSNGRWAFVVYGFTDRDDLPVLTSPFRIVAKA